MGKRKFHQRVSAPLVHLLSIATGSIIGTASAEPVIDQFVSGASVVANKNCVLLRVQFHARVRYIGHFPQNSGEELRISLKAIDPTRSEQLRLVRREAVAIDNQSMAGILSATLDVDRAADPALRILFSRATPYDVGQFGSFDSIAVALPRPGANAQCKVADFANSSPAHSDGADGPPPGGGAAVSSSPGPGKVSPANMKLIEASMDEARYAIRKKNYNEAIALLQKVLRFPENPATADALETLGEARQSAGQTAQARADFEEYLRRYADREGAARVRLRLGRSNDAVASDASSREASARRAGEPPTTVAGRSDPTSTWMTAGSISSFYIRDDSYNTVKDISIAPNLNADPDAHRAHQDTFLTNFDLFGTINSDQVRTKFKISGADEHRLQPSAPDVDRYGISTAFIETTLKEADVTARIGRQTRNTGGVIGRFDGGVVSWQANDMLRLNVVGGAANWSRFDAPFKDGRYLYGASLDVMRLIDGFDASVFAIQQNDRWFLDRRAVGAEFRYFKDNKSLLGMVDYDIHFQRLNAAVISGSWTFDDKSVLSGTFDRRRVPYLSSWNALIGQPYLTLYDMIKFNTTEDVRRFAIDRTPNFQSATASYSRPLDDHFQVSVDATATRLSGTLASGGVDGTLPIGAEYYISGQLMGANLFNPGDMYVGALRYARLHDSNVFFSDLNSRYIWSEDVQISPRFRAGYREGRTIPLRETTILPSLLIDYRWKPGLFLEGEVGMKWIRSNAAPVSSSTRDLYVTLGLRSDFSTEGMYRCAGQLAPCSGLLLGPPSTLQQVAHENLYYRDTLFNAEAPPVSSAFAVEGGFRYWLNKGGNSYDYFGDGTASTLVSRLNYAGLRSNSGEMFFRADARRGLIRNWFLKGYIGGGGLHGGKLYDEDFPPGLPFYSRTVSDTSGKLRYASIDLGYNVYTDAFFRLGAFVGFHSWFEKLDARGCVQTSFAPICLPPVPASVRLISEKDRWNSFRLGAVVDANLTDRLRWTGEIALTSNSQRAQDTHYFTFGVDPGKGNGGGFQAESALNYQLTDKFNVGVGVRWWRATNHAYDAWGQLMKYRTDRFGVFGQMSYRVNWGDFPVVPE